MDCFLHTNGLFGPVPAGPFRPHPTRMQLRFTLSSLCLAASLLGGPRPASAQTTYSIAPVTGFTDDVVVNGPAPATASATNPVDVGFPGVRWCYTAPTYTDPLGAAPQTALPASGLINSLLTPGLQFQLAPYTGLNALRIVGTGTGTLQLVVPQVANDVYVLAACGNGASAVAFTVAFTDGTTQGFNASVPDWYGGANAAIAGVSRVNFDTDDIEDNTADPRLYQVRLALAPANIGKLVQSVRFAKTSATVAPALNVLGLSLGLVCGLPAGSLVASAATVCPGGPVTLLVLALGIGGGYASQWQASVDNGLTWTDIAGATGPGYTANPLVSTRYRLRATCGTQAVLLGPVAVAVATQVARLSYGPARFCRDAPTNPVPTFAPAGGAFSAPAGLALDPATGTVNLAASAPGTYAVQYAPVGPCAVPATSSLTVVAPDQPTLRYDRRAYCRGGQAGVPAVAPAGGTFAAPAGLVLDAGTGRPDLAASVPGTYRVTYTSAGPCPGTALDTIRIQGAALPVFPNVITPNADGQNDLLRLRLTDISAFRLQVFSRWGRRVYETTDLTQGWTTTGNGPGTYYYEVEYTDCANAPQHYKGWLEVVK